MSQVFENCSWTFPLQSFQYIDKLTVSKVSIYHDFFVGRLEAKLCLALIFVSLIFTRVRKRSGKTWLDSLPGPKTYPIIGALHHFIDLKDTFRLLLTWSRKHGKIFKSEGIFNEKYIFLNDPAYIQAILSSNQLGLVGKPPNPYENVFGQFLRNGLLVSRGEYWKSHRRVVARAFTFKSFHAYIKIVNEYGKGIVQDLERLFPDEGKEFHEISSLVHCCSLQIIYASVMGLDESNSQEKELFKIFYEKFQRYKIISSEKAMNFFFLIEFIWRLHPMSKEYDGIIDILNGITRKIIARQIKDGVRDPELRRSSLDKIDTCGKPCRTMVDELLESGMTLDEVLIEVNTVIAAGFESTSLTIHYLIFLLALNPTHQKMCQDEIDEAFSDPVQSPQGNLSMDAVSNLKYLERCCLETLRMFPVIFVFQRRIENSLILEKGMEIPSGTNVIIPTYCIHHNPKYYPDPEKFDPDRFLPENIEQRHPYSYLPFSSGIRNCVGMKFAMLEIKAVAAHILRNFHVSTIDKLNDVPILPSIVMTPQRNYRFNMKRRHHKH